MVRHLHDQRTSVRSVRLTVLLSHLSTKYKTVQHPTLNLLEYNRQQFLPNFNHLQNITKFSKKKKKKRTFV